MTIRMRRKTTRFVHAIVLLFIAARGCSRSIELTAGVLGYQWHRPKSMDMKMSSTQSISEWNANNFRHFCSLNPMCQRKNYEFYWNIYIYM